MRWMFNFIKVLMQQPRRIIPSATVGRVSRDTDLWRNELCPPKLYVKDGFLLQASPTNRSRSLDTFSYAKATENTRDEPPTRTRHFFMRANGFLIQVLFFSSTVHSLPDFLKSSDRMAYELFEGKDFYKSQEILEQKLVDDPSNPLLNYNIGNVYYRQGNLDLARESFKRSAENSENKNNKLFELSKFNSGNCFYHSALSILGEDWENKDLSQEIIGAALQEAESSLECFKKVLEINDKNDHAPKNKKVVEELIEKLKKKSSSAKASEDKQQDQKNDKENQDKKEQENKDKQNQDQQNKEEQDKQEKENQNQNQEKKKQEKPSEKKGEKKENFEKRKMEAMLKKLDQDEKEIQKKMMKANLKDMKAPDNKYQKPW